MAPIEIKAIYDGQSNIMFVSFHGTFERFHEIDDIANGIVNSFKNVPTQRFWLVADFNDLQLATEDISATILVRRIHSKLGRLFKSRTFDRVVVTKKNSFIKAFISLLGAVIGKKAPVFDSIDHAILYINKQKLRQATIALTRTANL
jgi:hypothetical protein